MDPRAKEFVDTYYSDYLQAVSAVTEVLKAWGEYETSPASAVRNTFLVSSLAYIEYCGERVTDELAAFIMDVYCYLNDEITHFIDDYSNASKREFIFDYIHGISDPSIFTLEGLSGYLGQTLAMCQAYDDAADTSIRNRLAGALTRFAFLLIKTDDRITRSEESFYGLFKVGLAQALCTDPNVRQENNPNSVTNEIDNRPEDSSNGDALQRITNEVASLIGLGGIKSEVADLVNLLKVQKMRKDSELHAPEISRHMVFYGNPGTGKTTIARKLAQMYNVLGILSKGHLVEAERSTLVAGYLGQTAIKTKQVLEEAKGGILFIDEAYTLSQGGNQDQFGQEAIDTILKYMEDHRDDIVVVVAGYEERMSQFINSNPGLKSRFSKYFHFPDYSADELAQIFLGIAIQSQYNPTPAFESVLNHICQQIVFRKGENFGNGRTIRNLFEKCISIQANRVVLMAAPSSEQLMELTESDISPELVDLVMR